MITKTEVRNGSVGEKRGYCFEVYYDNRPSPNVISALFKTRLGTQRKLSAYVKTGRIDFYGNAE